MSNEFILYMAITFLLTGVIVHFVGISDSFLTCLVIAAAFILLAGVLKRDRLRSILYLLAALCIVVLPNTMLVPDINTIAGSVILIIQGFGILLNQIIVYKQESL